MKTWRKKGRRPRVVLVAGAWWCEGCLANGFLPARVEHRRRCRGAFRPLHWSPAPILVEARLDSRASTVATRPGM